MFPNYLSLANEKDDDRNSEQREPEENKSEEVKPEEPQEPEPSSQQAERPASRIETYDQFARYRDSSRPPDSHYPSGPGYRRSLESFCGDSVRWSHHVRIEHAYGVWHGVGYAQHTLDVTNKPIEVGCVTLYISDATGDYQYDWLDWSMRQTYNDSNWRSLRSNPWSGDALSGSWLDVRLRRKRDLVHQRRVRVLWDEDGQTMEQTYDYAPEEPGLWTTEQWRPGEREMRAKGVEVWYPEDPPRHPEVIRVLALTPDTMIINHCTELGDGGIFSLILGREPKKVDRWERLEWQKLLLSVGLNNPYRYIAVCAACSSVVSILCLIASVVVLKLL